MKIGVSVFRRIVKDHSHSTSAGVLFLPSEAVDRIGSQFVDVAGSLVEGLSLISARAESKDPTRLVVGGRGQAKVRLWMRQKWIGGPVQEHRKAFTEIDVEEPTNGVLSLPPIRLADLPWEEQVTDRDRVAKQTEKLAARVEGLRETVAAIPAKATRAKALATVQAPHRPVLFDVGDVQSAINFLNSARPAGVVYRITEDGELRAAIGLAPKGGFG